MLMNGSVQSSMSVAAIIVAGGRGARVGGDRPKQYRDLAGRPVLTRTLEVFLSHPAIDAVQVVIGAEDGPLYEAATIGCRDSGRKLRPPVRGGATRQESVRHGLEALAAAAPVSPGRILVHDGARPFADHALIDRAIAAGIASAAAIPALPVADTIKVVDGNGRVLETPDRASMRAVQTPQIFRFADLLAAHQAAAAAGLSSFPDDGALAEWAGLPVTVFTGDPLNVKLTHPGDFDEAEGRLSRAAAVAVTRVGSGFDVHAFGDGDHVWLGGVRIPHDRGVVAHSDGDVALHALTDAVLGALGDGDIGTHFPPSDERWRGAPSRDFLAFAAARVRDRGGAIDHLDATVLCEAPKVGPHREAMRAAIAAAAGIGPGQVSIKATTTERLGFVGRREGLAAQAVATIRLPPGP
jgi:2-C-methyl-D-erythritol 4-phosphate cytidylyltransferase/2-C-methyl-D-erythritol 2,4-cyclodiphosphate synthase